MQTTAWWNAMARSSGYDDERQMLANLYEEYRSLRKLAARLGYSVGCLRYRFQKLGLGYRPRGGANHTGHDGGTKRVRILELKDSMNHKTIARRLATSHSYVCQVIREDFEERGKP